MHASAYGGHNRERLAVSCVGGGKGAGAVGAVDAGAAGGAAGWGVAAGGAGGARGHVLVSAAGLPVLSPPRPSRPLCLAAWATLWAQRRWR